MYKPPKDSAKKLSPIRATVKAGEALFIPKGWYHNVLSVRLQSLVACLIDTFILLV